MNVLEQIVLGWHSLLFTLRHLTSRAMWLPWLLLGIVQLSIVAAIWWFAHPFVSWLMAPVLRRLGGEEVLHYPALFRAMPALYARADFVVTAVLGALAAGASTALFATALETHDGGPRPNGVAGLFGALRRALPLIAVNLPLNLLVVGFAFGLETWLAGRGSSGIIHKLGGFVTLGGALAIQAFFLYGTAWVVLGRKSFLGAWRELPHSAARGYWAALFLGILATLPLLPFQQIARHVQTLVSRGRPELAGWLVVAQVFVTLLTAFLLTGAITVVYHTSILRTDEEHGS
jgi:hypothetical protein